MKKNLLNSIEVKSPCNESWDEMFGIDEVRFCSHCAKDVHNLSSMTRAKAEKLLKSNKSLCVRYAKNPNGKVITAPPKLTQITRRATIAAGVLASSLALTTLAYAQGAPIKFKDDSTQTKKDKSKKTQQNQQLSTLSGTVTDEAGAIISRVIIKLKNFSTNLSIEAVSNEDGIYSFNKIESGNYQLTAKAVGYGDGFKELIIQNLKIGKNSNIKKDLVLKINISELMGVIVVADAQTTPKKKKN